MASAYMDTSHELSAEVIEMIDAVNHLNRKRLRTLLQMERIDSAMEELNVRLTRADRRIGRTHTPDMPWAGWPIVSTRPPAEDSEDEDSDDELEEDESVPPVTGPGWSRHTRFDSDTEDDNSPKVEETPLQNVRWSINQRLQVSVAPKHQIFLLEH